MASGHVYNVGIKDFKRTAQARMQEGQVNTLFGLFSKSHDNTFKLELYNIEIVYMYHPLLHHIVIGHTDS